MLIQKLLAAVGLAGALLLGIAAPAEARGWGGGGRFHHGPVYGGGFRRGPVYNDPGYRGSVYVAPPVYRPGYRGVDWRRHEWRREHGHFGYRY